MKRIPEEELMTGDEQVKAYSEADFSEGHNAFVDKFKEIYENESIEGPVLDLACGPCDVTVRMAKAFPELRFHAIDGSDTMLRYAKERLKKEGLKEQIKLIQAYLPVHSLEQVSYPTIISNSLLHHLPDPLVLWQTIKTYSAPGSLIFVQDLYRPESVEQAKNMLHKHATGEPEILKRDFYNSLLAAFSQEEIEQRLLDSELNLSIKKITDRHIIIFGKV